MTVTIDEQDLENFQQDIATAAAAVNSPAGTVIVNRAGNRIRPFAELGTADGMVAINGNQTINDTKTFSLPIVIPDGTAPHHAASFGQLTATQGMIAAAADGVLAAETLADLNANLAHAAGTFADVWGDPTLANNRRYVKLGGTGTGSWTTTTDRVDSEILRATTAEAALSAGINLARDEAGANSGAISQDQNYVFVPSDYAQGTCPPEVILSGGATAVVDAAGFLEVTSAYNAGVAVRCILNKMFREGILSFQIVNGNKFSLSYHNAPDGSGFRIWTDDGATLKMGYMPYNGGVPIVFDSVAIPGAANDLINLRLQVGATYNNSAWTISGWKEGNAVPTLASGVLKAGTFPITANALPCYNEGQVILESVAGGGAAKFGRISIIDGTESHSAVDRQATFVGNWFTRYESFTVCKWTCRHSSYFRFRVKGSAGVYAYIVQSALGAASANAYPYLYVYINGTYTGTPLIVNGAAGGAYYKLNNAGDLDTSGAWNDIEVVVGGLDEQSDEWLSGYGVGIGNLATDAGAVAGFIAPLPEGMLSLVHIGDSIPAGMFSRGVLVDQSAQHGGDIAYPKQACRLAGFELTSNCFGGTGFTCSGAHVPPTLENASNYMKNRKIDRAKKRCHYLVFDLGQNDYTTGASSAAFTAAATAAILDGIRYWRPSQTILLIPFGGMFAAEITALATSLGYNIQVEDKRTWGVTGFQSDAVHLTHAGQNQASTPWASYLISLKAATPLDYGRWA